MTSRTSMETMPVTEILVRTRAYARENFLYMRPDVPLGDDRRIARQRGH